MRLRNLMLGICAAALASGAVGAVAAEIPVPTPRPAIASETPRQAAAQARKHSKAQAQQQTQSRAKPQAQARSQAQGPKRVAVAGSQAPRLEVQPPSGSAGWIAIDLDTGAVIDQFAADTGFAPASVAKLPTAAFALDALGPDHRFETRVLATGPVRDGQVLGDLVLQGGGDPELDTDALLPLARALEARGVRSVMGALVADGSALPQVSEITRAQEVDAAYNPSVSGLNLNFNRVNLKWDARKGGEALSVEAASARLSPAVEGVRVTLASAPGAPLFSFQEQDGLEVWEMARWAYKGAASRWLPVKRPETYAAEVFRKLAAGQGLVLPAARPGLAQRGASVLAVTHSRPLGDILRAMLKHSTNLTAEVTGAASTRAAGLDARTLAASAEVMNAWAAQVAGFPVGDPGFRFVNHSGLTLDSRVSPRRMVELLAALAKRGGKDRGLPGGVAQYLRPHAVHDRTPKGLEIVAKTGTMSYVRGLAGYVVTPRGRRLAFAIFSNDLSKRGDGPERVDQGWMGRAKAFERALVRNWVARVDGA